VTRLTIGGPDSVAPGGQVQLSVRADLTDGSSRDVSGEVEWGGGNDILSVSPTGLVTAGVHRGEGYVTAKYTQLPYVNPGSAWTSRQQFVLPSGTYRLYGSVRDEGVLLDGVRVEITAGSAAGMAVTANGFFRFYGVEGDTEVRLSKPGYEAESRRFTVTSHHTEEFALRLSTERPRVDGGFTLRVTAASECRASLPPELHSRTYSAAIAQDGPRLTVTLGRAAFPQDPLLGPGNRFSGKVEPDRIIFFVDSYDDDGSGTGVYPPSVLEVLAAPLHFSFYGRVVARRTADGYAGALDGAIARLRVLSVYDYQLDSYCVSSGHEFSLTR
jgi:hypothetical protein